MNGNFYQNPTFPNNEPIINQITPPGNISSQSVLSMEQSLWWNYWGSGKRSFNN